MNTIQERWEFFCKTRIAEDTPIQQILELKIAFYAGSSGAISILSEVSEYSPDAFKGTFNGLIQEWNDFIKSFQKEDFEKDELK